MRLPKYTHFLLFFILVGSFLRLYNLDFQTMNYDEQFTIGIASPSVDLIAMIIKTLTYDFTPPFYYIAAHLSMLIFGETAFAIRLPSAIFGILLIPIMYIVGKEYRDELFGVLLAAFTTIFYNFVFYSKYGRSYSMCFAFFTLAFYFFMKLLKEQNTKNSILFGVFSACAMWTHLYSSIPIAVMVVYLLIEKRDLISAGVTTILSLPLFNYINVVLSTRDIASGGQSFGATPFEIIVMTPIDIFTYSWIIVFPIIILSLWKHRSERLLTVITWMGIITWGSMLVLSFKTPIILHYAIFVVPALLLALWNALEPSSRCAVCR